MMIGQSLQAQTLAHPVTLSLARAQMACDFTTGSGWLNGRAVPLDAIFECNRNTPAWDEALTYTPPGQLRLSAKGLRVEETRRNLLQDAFAPAAQTVTIPAGTWALSCGPNGSVALSGDVMGEATPGQARIFTCDMESTLEVTPLGGPSWFQLEEGAFATSPIETDASGGVTRAADRVVALSPDWLDLTDCNLAIEWVQEQAGQTAQNGVHNLLRWTTSGGFSRLRAGTATLAQIRGASGTLAMNSGLNDDTPLGNHRLALRVQGDMARVSWSASLDGAGGAIELSNPDFATEVETATLGGSQGNEFLNGTIRRLIVVAGGEDI